MAYSRSQINDNRNNIERIITTICKAANIKLHSLIFDSEYDKKPNDPLDVVTKNYSAIYSINNDIYFRCYHNGETTSDYGWFVHVVAMDIAFLILNDKYKIIDTLAFKPGYSWEYPNKINDQQVNCWDAEALEFNWDEYKNFARSNIKSDVMSQAQQNHHGLFQSPSDIFLKKLPNGVEKIGYEEVVRALLNEYKLRSGERPRR